MSCKTPHGEEKDWNKKENGAIYWVEQSKAFRQLSLYCYTVLHFGVNTELCLIRKYQMIWQWVGLRQILGKRNRGIYKKIHENLEDFNEYLAIISKCLFIKPSVKFIWRETNVIAHNQLVSYLFECAILYCWFHYYWNEVTLSL